MFVIYDENSLQPRYTVNTASENYGDTLTTNGEKFVIIPDDVNAPYENIDIYRNDDGEIAWRILTDRPSLAFDRTTIAVDTGIAIVDPCPEGTMIIVDGIEAGMTDGLPFEFSSNEPGTFSVYMLPPRPWLSSSVQITVE